MRQAASRYERIAFVASPVPEARKALARLVRRYGNVPLSKADVVVALGGDGLMLRTLHRLMKSGKPIYGMHRGTIGFLMNDYEDRRLRERLTAAETTVIHPLIMRARDTKNRQHVHHAIN
jgi:NAD+ kinase